MASDFSLLHPKEGESSKCFEPRDLEILRRSFELGAQKIAVVVAEDPDEIRRAKEELMTSPVHETSGGTALVLAEAESQKSRVVRVLEFPESAPEVLDSLRRLFRQGRLVNEGARQDPLTQVDEYAFILITRRIYADLAHQSYFDDVPFPIIMTLRAQRGKPYAK